MRRQVKRTTRISTEARRQEARLASAARAVEWLSPVLSSVAWALATRWRGETWPARMTAHQLGMYDPILGDDLSGLTDRTLEVVQVYLNAEQENLKKGRKMIDVITDDQLAIILGMVHAGDYLLDAVDAAMEEARASKRARVAALLRQRGYIEGGQMQRGYMQSDQLSDFGQMVLAQLC
mgnify:CR=1 FL=1